MRSLMKALVRLRIAEGWHAWVAPDRRTYWARFAPDTPAPVSLLQVLDPEPGELAVLDEVLREKVS